MYTYIHPYGNIILFAVAVATCDLNVAARQAGTQPADTSESDFQRIQCWPNARENGGVQLL